MESLFTTNELIDSFQLHSDIDEVCGYVDCIEGRMFLNKKMFWSIIINNNEGRRIRIIFCEEQALFYLNMIQYQSIITFHKIHCRTNKEYHGIKQDNMYKFQLRLRDYSTISIHSDVFKGVTIDHEAIMLKDVFIQRRVYYVIAYLKINFEIVHDRRFVYASGVVTDGRFEVSVRAFHYEKIPQLMIGQLIRFMAEWQIDNRNHNYLSIININNLEIFDIFLSEEQLRRGILAPPRNHMLL